MGFCDAPGGDLVLSVFSGIDLLGKGFQKNGFCVVSAGDKFLGSDIRSFYPPKGFFGGVIGGSPCQDFSRLNRNPKSYSDDMLKQYIRVIESARPNWFLHENVVGVPEFSIDGYIAQRFELDLNWFNPELSRRRIFTFGIIDCCDSPGKYLLNPIIKNNTDVLHKAITCKSDLPVRKMAEIQGCYFERDLEHFTVAGKKAVIGNAVPFVMADYLGKLVKDSLYLGVTCPGKKCKCGCGRRVDENSSYAHQNCRKKYNRANKCDSPGKL